MRPYYVCPVIMGLGRDESSWVITTWLILLRNDNIMIDFIDWELGEQHIFTGVV